MTIGKNSRSPRSTSTFVRVGIVGLILLAVAFTFAQKHAAAQSVAPASQVIQDLVLVGTSTIQASAPGDGSLQLPEIAVDAVGDSSPKVAVPAQPAAPSGLTNAHNLAIPSKEEARQRLSSSQIASGADSAESQKLPLPEPVIESDFVVSSHEDDSEGFNGLSHIDQRTANHGNQFSIEPPDQGLCAGNGYVIETVNTVIRVFDDEGNPLSGVQDLNSFFGLPPQIIRGNPNRIGPSIGDPRCYFDPQVRRWFVTVFLADSGNNPGATGRDFNLLAVSQTDHPTGAFTIFMYDVTDDGLNGTPKHAGCPCFGDQPLLGADKYGVFQTTNEFPNVGPGFNGAQIYAISKEELVEAANSPTGSLPVVVHIDASQQLVPFGGLSYSIQPAVSPAGEKRGEGDNESNRGDEYFLSALQFGNPGYEVFDNRIAVWAVSNTKSLSSDSPELRLSFDVMHSETYGQPNPAIQKAGETPLATSLADAEEFLNTNDDRMNQVVYVGGLLYGGVNSLLKVDGAEHQGIAWFAVKPNFEGGELEGRVVKEGYVALARADVFFPSIGVNEAGDGVIAFSLSGADNFPSAAYVKMEDGESRHVVHIAAAGQDPDDGFTGYVQYTGDPSRVARWGDYSAAVVDGDRIWFASEYIPKACSSLALPCRTSLANWGTFVSAIRH